MRSRLHALVFTVVSLSLSTVAEAQRAYPVDLLIIPVTQNVRRQAIAPGDDVPLTTSGTIRGLEAFLLPAGGGVGVFGRYHTSNLGVDSKPWMQEAGLLLGDASFRLEFAYSARYHLPQDSVIPLVRAGFGGTTILGTSGVALRVRASYFVPVDRFEGAGENTDGWEGETTLSYTWDRFPLSAHLGYRLERLRVVDFEEENSAVTLGFGLWLQRRR